jgi:hypothetical protein
MNLSLVVKLMPLILAAKNFGRKSNVAIEKKKHSLVFCVIVILMETMEMIPIRRNLRGDVMHRFTQDLVSCIFFPELVGEAVNIVTCLINNIRNHNCTSGLKIFF